MAALDPASAPAWRGTGSTGRGRRHTVISKPHTSSPRRRSIPTPKPRTGGRSVSSSRATRTSHACVVLWSIANEPESVTPEARAYFEPLVRETRRLDPSRPVGFVNVPGATPDQDKITDLFDVVMLNRYYGWYVNPGDVAAAERALEAELKAWAEKHKKPIILTEFGADTLEGLHDVVPGPWTEEYEAGLLEMHHRVFDRIEAVVGEQVWNFADFATVPGVMRVGGNKKGVFTRERRPKAAASILRRRWQDD
jgi:beta-glucuronidase